VSAKEVQVGEKKCKETEREGGLRESRSLLPDDPPATLPCFLFSNRRFLSACIDGGNGRKGREEGEWEPATADVE
jgi:hypothetical protein